LSTMAAQRTQAELAPNRPDGMPATSDVLGIRRSSHAPPCSSTESASSSATRFALRSALTVPVRSRRLEGCPRSPTAPSLFGWLAGFTSLNTHYFFRCARFSSVVPVPARSNHHARRRRTSERGGQRTNSRRPLARRVHPSRHPPIRGAPMREPTAPWSCRPRQDRKTQRWWSVTMRHGRYRRCLP
jgi:hypothetical protein